MERDFTRIPARMAAVAGFCLATFLAASCSSPNPGDAVLIDPDDIGGAVTGPNGPEAGVWVIAETRELGVRYIKSVVTDDQGRYAIPDLPAAQYDVWARGYGLVDSAKAKARPGAHVNITAVPAPDEAAAATYYPAIYWYSMLKIPSADQFGSHPDIGKNFTQTRWLDAMKSNGCVGCHQLGQESTRSIPKELGTFASGAEAWRRRVQSGQSGQMMLNQLTALGPMSFQLYGDWTDRIAKGELPHAKPQRPQGVERNIVVTLRDWMNEKQYLHDLIASDRRYPTVNAYGPLFGSPEYSSDDIPVLDPVKNIATTFKAPVRDADMPLSLGPGHAAGLDALQPSAYWGGDRIWDTRVNNHNSMFGRDGRLWLAAAVRGPDNPAFCKAGSDHPSAKLFPVERTNRHLAVFDPKTQKYTFVDTCFGTHHLQFAYDNNETLWTSGGGPVVGWLNTKMFDETGDAAKSQGWTALVLDTNGNGKQDAYVEPISRATPRPGQTHQRGLLRGDAQPRGRIGVGLVPRRHQRRRPHRAGGESACDCDRRGLQRARARLRRARGRHRQAGCGVGVAGQWTPGQLRPAQVQGATQRPESHRRSLSGWLVLPSVSGPRLRGHWREQRGVQLLHLGGPARHLRPRRGRAHVHGQPERRPHRAERWADDRPARALPDGLLREGLRRAH
jgi:hypothetical protein